MVSQSIRLRFGDDNGLYQMLERYVDEKVNTIEESQIIFQLNTTLNHLQEKFELNGVSECLVQQKTKLLMLDFDIVVDYVHSSKVKIMDLLAKYYEHFLPYLLLYDKL